MKDTGGQAFPSPVIAQGTGYHYGASGMTLRDWFAGLAMQAMLTNPSIESLPDAHAPGVAKWAYTQADAMLVKRAKE